MAEISKQALIVENNQSFPNNNNGQITPSVLREFNRDMIDSTVNQTAFNNYTQSFTVTFDALNAFTASVAGTNAFTQSANTRITSLESWSSSLDVSYASQAEFNAYTQSQTLLSQSFDLRIDNLESWSSSLDTNYTSQTEFNSYTQSNDAKVNSLIAFTSSVLSVSALVPLNNFTASAQLEINALEGFTASIAGTNAFTQSIQAEVDDIQAKTGSFATTGSNVFTGTQTLSDASLNTATLATISGSLVLVGKTFASSSAALAHISASSADQVNFIWKANAGTQRTIVSGSNNIFTNPSNVTAGFVRYVGGQNNIYPLAIPSLTGSAAFPITMGSNFMNASVLLRTPVSSSAYTMNGNVISNVTGTSISLGTATATSFDKAVSGLTFSNNLINGTVNATAYKTSLSSSVSITNNNIGGTATLNMDSSSINFSNVIAQSSLTVNNSYFPTTFNSNTANFTIGGLLNIGPNFIYASGSNTTFTGPPRTLTASGFIGGGNVISASLNGDLAQVNSTILLGQSLVAIGTNSRPTAATAADWGSVFAGRWNSIDGTKDLTAETVFAVGTGTAEANRKTGFLIDSGSNTFVEGTLNVSGSSSFTGSMNFLSGSASGSVITSVGDTFTGTDVVTKIISLSSAEYTALSPKDPNTLYIII